VARASPSLSALALRCLLACVAAELWRALGGWRRGVQVRPLILGRETGAGGDHGIDHHNQK
jgi:hypothetical protein